MPSVYAATTPEWLNTVSALPPTRRVAFWQPSPANPRRIREGERWYFKELGRPVIRGYGLFRGWETSSIADLFRRYGNATGYVSEVDLLAAMRVFKNSATLTTNVGNVILDEVFIFDDPLRLQDLGLADLPVRFVYLNDGDPMEHLGARVASAARGQEAVLSSEAGSPTTGLVPSGWTREVANDATKEAYVYALRFGSHDLWKVGWAVDVKKRLKMINDHIPDEIVPDKWHCIYFERTDSKVAAYRAEQAVLSALATFRTRGERVACDERVFSTAWLGVISSRRSQSAAH